jgi:hypothetical protein
MISSRGERLQLMLTPEELNILDEFRFKHQMPSRAAAVRELLMRGLAAEGFDGASPGVKSSQFGVIKDSDADHSKGSHSKGSAHNGDGQGPAE